MGLSEDQKAMLRLLAQREQGYEDIAALMGTSVEEVRERVKSALGQLESEGGSAEGLRPAGPVAEDDSSSSQAAGEEPPSTPPAGEAPAETSPPKERVQEPPPPPAQPSSPVPQEAAPAAKRQGSGLPKLALPESQGARTAIAAGALALVVLVVVLVVGGGGDGESESTVANGSAPSGAEGEPTSGNAKELTKAVLQPVGGSGATGVAIFGRVGNDSLALQVEAEGLNPTPKGESYAIWVAASPQRMLPLASTAVGQDGRIATQFAVPAEVLGYLANETFGQIAITEVEDSRLEAALDKATSKEQAPSYTGTEVLRGPITGPIVGAAN